MELERSNLEVAIDLRRWIESRGRSRRRARTIAANFGLRRLGHRARSIIGAALAAAGINAVPSFADCRLDDWLQLSVVGEAIDSQATPSQIVAYLEHNWTGSGDSGPVGEWLRCLAATSAGDRQLVWHGSAVAGVVTFAGWIRQGPGFYEGWGSLQRLDRPVSREQLLSDGRTRARFGPRGIRGLQGSPIRLPSEIAAAIVEMLGGLSTTVLPLNEPDYHEEQILWAGLHGLGPEAHIEAAIEAVA